MKSVLLVDDSTTLLSSMQSILVRSGYEVHTATSGPDALRQVDSGYSPDLVITDLHMPEMNGIELIRVLRTRRPLRFAPILMLTTESQQSRRQEARSAGATGWLVKPVKPADLLAVMGKVLPGQA